MCDELDFVLIMDQTTHNGWVVGFPRINLPDVIHVVPSETRHTEKDLYVVTVKHKTEICKWSPTVAETSVFRNCLKRESR